MTARCDGRRPSHTGHLSALAERVGPVDGDAPYPLKVSVIRILILASIFSTRKRPRHGGGSDAVSRAVAAALVERGHHVSVIRGEQPGALPEQADGITVYDAGAPNLYRWTQEHGTNPVARALWHKIDDRGPPGRSAMTALDAVKPDVVASHNLSGLGTGIWRAAAAQRIPIVHTLHDYHLLCPRTIRRRAGRDCTEVCRSCRLFTAGRRSDAALVHSAVSVSQHVLDVHRRSGLFNNIGARVIHNVAKPVASVAPASLDVSRPARVGFMGRGSDYKGFPLLLRAFAALRMPAELLIAGEIDSGVARLMEQHPKRAAIRSLGIVEPADFYPQVDLLVVPSRGEEAFGSVCVEAQAYGRPVVASNKGGIPEAMGVSDRELPSDVGWLFDPDIPGGLAQLLDDVLSSPGALRAKAEAALSRSRRHDPSAFGDAYEAAYRAALA